MRRRSLFAILASAVAAGPAMAAPARATRVVYHLSDLDKVPFVLGNMKNHRAGGPPDLALAAVVHGPALSAFQAHTPDDALKRHFEEALAAGDTVYACANTLAAHGWTLADLLPGFALAAEGGVVKLADLQAQGFVYLRP